MLGYNEGFELNLKKLKQTTNLTLIIHNTK